VTIERQIRAVRFSAALADTSHVACIRASGADVHEALDRLLPCELGMLEGRMRHTLMLDGDGTILADLYVCLDDDGFYLLVEGLDAEKFVRHAREQLPEGTRVAFDDLGETHRLLSVCGPYAWELLAKAVDPEIVGLPYLTFYDMESWICFRAGKTGEYGYDLLLPTDMADETRARLIEVGERFDLGTADLETLDQCALENWFFNIRREGRSGAGPIELQLQWRISYGKQFVGSEALAAQRAAGPERRLTCLIAGEPVAIGERVFGQGRDVGEVVNAGRSDVRGDWIGLALIEIGLAHPGIDFLVVTGAGVERTARSVSPPVINNRSFHVSPQLHTFGARDEDDLPDPGDYPPGRANRPTGER
jgi:aminomethyltransferase